MEKFDRLPKERRRELAREMIALALMRLQAERDLG
jgi:hypothetical protein